MERLESHSAPGAESGVKSKNQAKRERKEQRWLAKKQEMKEAKKLARKPRTHNGYKAAEEEVKQVTDEATGEVVVVKANRKERKRLWTEIVGKAMKVVVDCDFEECMKENEVKSLARQLMFGYSANKRSRRPVGLVFTGCKGKVFKQQLHIQSSGNWSVDVHEK
mmetsp:Transcript_13371/g.15499  ORF Transcript_13371/g.15499 Transcript_13371/m.15499 type:complete len:164 (-) Transcript_13371:474-965(-)